MSSTKGNRPQGLKVAQVAAMLGFKEATVRNWMHQGRIAYHRLGTKAVRIDRQEVDRILSESLIPAKSR